ncbi:MAG: ribonuclease HI family protein [Myxococcota bacterium]
MSKKDLKDRIYNILIKYGVETDKAENVVNEIITLLENGDIIKNELIAYIDGGSRGNPGCGASACIIFRNNRRLIESVRYFESITNNEAEYNALILALSNGIRLKANTLTVYTDSELLERQMRGIYLVKSPNLIPLYRKANELIQKFKSFSIKHIPREQNREADRLANMAMDSRRDFTKRYDR